MSEAITFCDQEKKKVIQKTKELEDYDAEKKEEIEEQYEEINNIMHGIFFFFFEPNIFSCNGYNWKALENLQRKD